MLSKVPANSPHFQPLHASENIFSMQLFIISSKLSYLAARVYYMHIDKDIFLI